MDSTKLRADRCRLSPFRSTDAAALYAADCDPEHRRRFEFAATFVPSLDHAAAVIARWEREWAAGERFAFAVRRPSTGEVLGGCELRPLGRGGAALSYWTLPRYRSEGIATCAVSAVCELARFAFHYEYVEAEVDIDNPASRRVAERSGFEPVESRGSRVVLRRDLPATGRPT